MLPVMISPSPGAGVNEVDRHHRLIALDYFTRLALSACPVFWTQFNIFLMDARDHRQCLRRTQP